VTAILVVDDVAAMAEQYAYDLKRVGGYETLVAKSGREAFDLLEREAVDCVILDLEMPGMDGFEVLRGMDRRGFRIPVIVYTGTGNYDRCIQAIRLGARSFIDEAEPMERVRRREPHAPAAQGRDRPRRQDSKPGADLGGERLREGARCPRAAPPGREPEGAVRGP